LRSKILLDVVPILAIGVAATSSLLIFEILHFNSFIKRLFTSHPISPSEIVMIVLKDEYICSAQATLFVEKKIFRKVMLEGNP
jgi:hypothetical protein